MVTKTFVAKVNRIINDKANNYYIHRINIPSEVVEELKLGKEDFLLFKAKKAEWYDMLDWSEMKATWDKLPQEIKNKIKEDGIYDGTDQFKSKQKHKEKLIVTTAPSLSAEEFLIRSTAVTGVGTP